MPRLWCRVEHPANNEEAATASAAAPRHPRRRCPPGQRCPTAARIAVGRALIGVLVGEFFAASEGIGYAISLFGSLFAIDRMFACILTVMVIAVVLTEGIRWAERAAFPWRAGQ